jgi:hypothetical protein
VLINTLFPQGDIGGNAYERHRSFWAASDFRRWPAEIDVKGGTLTVALRGSGAITRPMRRFARAESCAESLAYETVGQLLRR